MYCIVMYGMVYQGLIVQAGAVSTPYAYEACSVVYVFQDSKVCIDWVTVEVESAPVIPPFTYNNQCSSVLLTSYIPVLIIGLSIQLVMCFIVPVILCQAGKWLDLTEIIHRKMLKGILWPEFWLNSDDSDLASRNKAHLENDPTIILNSKTILCFNILNNVLVMLTFGLCSPVLAAAVTCVVVAKMNVLLLLVGRFAAVLSSDDSSGSMHFALAALAKVSLPVNEVLKRSFWVIVRTSALFVSLVCWDIASDEVGWADCIWIPLTVICYPLVLWSIAFCVGYRCQGTPAGRAEHCREVDVAGVELVTGDKDVELAAAASVPSPPSLDTDAHNPLHASHSY